MLAALSELMEYAQRKKMAIGAFNTPNLESLQAVIGAAEESDLPVIAQFAQCHEENMSLSVIGPIMVDMARRAKTPVCVHLDHGEAVEYLERALRIGFNSVMYDGSALPYEQNLLNTKKAVAAASVCNAEVEAELGSLGRRESGGTEKEGEEKDGGKIYTDPEMAAAFVKETKIAALACSFGTAHGIYLEKPRLNLEIVRKVRKLTGDIPVVMHGGSGLEAGEYRAVIDAGVRKINYFTYMDKAGGRAAGDYMREKENGGTAFFMELSRRSMLEMKEHVKEAMRWFAP